ncbi:hypothetical protein AMS58_01220 [Pseudoalteromonas porphyrae]|uniref:Diguanylate phosphodiesterase n=2 Tax=Pseudoalteromonas TaxID=53246 RepID=A0A0N1ERU6_9GAMM|nr:MULTISPECIES: GGDEF domain-containing phosphodiesterase [Pseudoalteromonas]KPH61776.1 hypothetical protein ADS77_14090 [Pseudoalteromonas porphyrae]KPH96214.1 hypothetical protein AMS58_01220 [Pseudoalteromonas porphyrae]NMR25217.1 EAL domain-containing protein [Pseudoalteromonas sp. NEC-BIFX-2020_015]
MFKMGFLKSKKLLAVGFSLTLATVAFVILRFDQPLIAQLSYVVFLVTLGLAFALSNVRYKQGLAAISFLFIFMVGLLFHLDIEVIEEVYLLIPLLYLMVFPGSMLPIPIAVLLLSAYVSSINAAEFLDIIEDGVEMIVITSFATIMTYFQRKTHSQMELFRTESYTDYLTGLGNRKKFFEVLLFFKEQCREDATLNFSLLIIDLDGFKKVNDQLGHLTGDSALKMVTDRFSQLIDEDSLLFRIGGDEFAFITTPSNNSKQVARALANAIHTLSKPSYLLKAKNYQLTASIGIAIFPEDATEIEILCSNADMAMYHAKAVGKNDFSFYQSQLTKQTLRRYRLENDLKFATERGELALHYQPKVCITTGEIKSAEALIRWFHPQLGFISPVEFIPIAEQTGLINPIGEWITETACQQIAHWKKQFNIESVAINVSAIQLQDPLFLDKLTSALARNNCTTSCLEIEQTETALMANANDNIRVLTALKNAGLTLSLDDFGTAYSSLCQLSLLPLDILKIDKRFIDDCTTNRRDHMVVRTIIQLAQNLGMGTIAEGVETPEQLALLKQEGCQLYQGYFFSKPLSAEDFTALLRAC